MKLYQNVFNLLGNLVSIESIGLFINTSTDEKSLYDILLDLNTMCISAQKQYKTSNQLIESDELVTAILNLFSMILPCYTEYIKHLELQQGKKKLEETQQKTEQEIYIKTMIELRDLDEDFKIVNTNYHYQTELNTQKNNEIYKRCIKTN